MYHSVDLNYNFPRFSIFIPFVSMSVQLLTLPDRKVHLSARTREFGTRKVSSEDILKYFRTKENLDGERARRMAEKKCGRNEE